MPKDELNIPEITFKVAKVEKAHSIADGTDYLDVAVDIYGDGEFIEVRKLAFPLDSSSEDIESELLKYKETYIQDLTNARINEERDVEQANADSVIESLSDKEL